MLQRVNSGIAFAGVMVLLLGCRGTARRSPPLDVQGPAPVIDLEAERKAVYETVLRAYIDRSVDRLVIDPVTAPDLSAADRAPPLRLRGDTKADYQRDVAGAMPVDLNVGLPIVWFDEADW